MVVRRKVRNRTASGQQGALLCWEGGRMMQYSTGVQFDQQRLVESCDKLEADRDGDKARANCPICGGKSKTKLALEIRNGKGLVPSPALRRIATANRRGKSASHTRSTSWSLSIAIIWTQKYFAGRTGWIFPTVLSACGHRPKASRPKDCCLCTGEGDNHRRSRRRTVCCESCARARRPLKPSADIIRGP